MGQPVSRLDDVVVGIPRNTDFGMHPTTETVPDAFRADLATKPTPEVLRSLAASVVVLSTTTLPE